MNKTLLKMALLTCIINPTVMASADDSRQTLTSLQQMEDSLTQHYSKVDTLETRLSTLEQEKSSPLPKTHPTLATEPTQQAEDLFPSIADVTTPTPWEMLMAKLEEFQRIYPWFDLSPELFTLSENPRKAISVLKEIKEAGTDKEKLQNIRSRMEKGRDLYINKDVTGELTRFLDIILSPHYDLLQNLISYDSNILYKKLSSNSLCADNLRNLEDAIRSKLISIDRIDLSGYGKLISGAEHDAEEMLIRLMSEGFFNQLKVLYLGSHHLHNLCDLATTMMLQGIFKNIQSFEIYCDNIDKAQEIVEKVIAAKKAGKLDKLSTLLFARSRIRYIAIRPESQELRKELVQLGVQTNLASPW